jgi:hypothetical protein
MECFNHSGKLATGICQRCGKAGCPECLTIEEGRGVVCARDCAYVVQEPDASVRESRRPPWWRGVTFPNISRLLMSVSFLVIAAIGLATFGNGDDDGERLFMVTIAVLGIYSGVVSLHQLRLEIQRRY